MLNLNLYPNKDLTPSIEQLNNLPSCLFVHEKDQLIQGLINPNINGPWIAGGACLAWYQNKPCTTDIDVYFTNEKQFSAVEQNLRNFKFSELISTSKNALTFAITRSDEKWTIQIIRKQFYPSLKSVISDFDITVCQIGWDGNKITVGEHFVRDVADRVLRFDNFSPQSHKRLVKYMCYGYKPVDNCIEELIENINIDWHTKGSDHYA